MNAEEKLEKIIKEVKAMPLSWEVKQALNTDGQLLESLAKKLTYQNWDKEILEDTINFYIQQYDSNITAATGFARDSNVAIEIMNGKEWLTKLMSDIGKEDADVQLFKFHTYFIKSNYVRTQMLERAKKLNEEWNKADFTKKVKMIRKGLGKVGNKLKSGWETSRMIADLMSHVLGQYDNLGKKDIDHKVLRFLTPNIIKVAKDAGVNTKHLLLDVAIHEDTHNRQFSHYPNLDSGIKENILPLYITKKIKDFGGFEDMTKSEAESLYKKIEDRLQTTMCVVEGHATFFEREVMKEAIPNEYESFRQKLKAYSEKRRRPKKGEFDKKRQQYIKGLKFVEEIHKIHKVNTSKLIFDNMPKNMSEIENPSSYLKRV